MITETKRVKAVESANRRMRANQDAIRAAYAGDLAEGPSLKQRKQWQAACQWLKSEAKQLTDEQRTAVLGQVIQLAQDMNNMTRTVVE